MARETLAILVGGGPAPGINGVIAAAAIEALNCDLRAIGIYDGYRDLAAGGKPKTVELTFDHVSRIHTTGGSILRTSRTNPAQRRSDARALRHRARYARDSLPGLHRRRRHDVRRGQDRRTHGEAASALQRFPRRSTTICRSPKTRRRSASRPRARSVPASWKPSSRTRARRRAGTSSSAWDASPGRFRWVCVAPRVPR